MFRRPVRLIAQLYWSAVVCSGLLFELNLHLAVLIDHEFVVDFDSFNYPAKCSALPNKRVNPILAFEVVDGDHYAKALRFMRAALVSR